MFRRVLYVLLGIGAVVGSGLAGVWLARSPFGGNAPLTLNAVVGADASVVKAAVAGRVRLVAVREGDAVRQGQLVAWLDAPLLRDGLRAAQESVSAAQDQLDARRSGRRSRPQEDLARAEEDAAAAQRALESAEELSRQASDLAARVEAAHAAQQEAAAALAAAEAAASAAGESPAPGAQSSGALESGGTPAANPSPNPAAAELRAAVTRARARKDAADRELAEARRLSRRAERATERLATLSEEALRAASAAQEARARADSAPATEESGTSDEDRLSKELRDAQLTAAQARAMLRAAVVVAPTGGLVENVAAATGQELSEGDAIATVRQLDTAWAEVVVPARSAGRVRRGQKVAVQPADDPGAAVQGEVTSVSPQGTDSDSPWVVRVTFKNPGGRLLPGSDVQVTLK